MRPRPALLAACLALAFAGVARAADVAGGDPAPPRSASREDAEQWVAANVQLGQFLAAAITPTGALSFDPYTLQLAPDGVRATVRGELYALTATPAGAIRSDKSVMAVNCSGKKLLVLSRIGYPHNNLQGDSIQIDTTGEAWSETYADATPQAALIRQVCSVASLYKDGTDPTKALPRPPESLADDQVRDWMGQYVDDTGERLVWVGQGAGAFLSPKTATRSAEGRPVVWLHTELAQMVGADETVMHSMREHAELDCPGQRYRDLEADIYPGANLTGQAYHLDADPDWTTPGGGWLAGACAVVAPQPSSKR